MKLYKYSLLFLAIIAFAFNGESQNTTSPYSKYGYGLLGDHATSTQRAMGGVGYAMSNGRQVNVMNPASYAAIDSLTFLFDIGLDLTNMWSSETATDGSKVSGNAIGGGLDYITMQFPIGKRMGASIGLLPYSSVGYSFGDEVVNGTSGHSGSGGLNELYAGISGRVVKGLSVGANISYMFGNIVEDTYAYTSNSQQSLFEQVIKVQDWNVNVGIQYSQLFKKKHKVTLGFVYTPGKTLLGNAYGVKYDIINDTKPDTIAEHKLKGNYSVANSFGAGISYTYDRRITVEADFTYQDWAKAKYKPIEGFENTTFSNRWKVAAGGEIIPSLTPTNYLQIIRYRLGAFYDHSYINVMGNNVREMGASVGFGFPLTSSKTIINLGLEYKRRQSSPTQLLKEDYFNITVGINFNELWFLKTRIN